MNFGCVLLDVATIRIGDDVQVGPNVQFLTPTHPVEAEPRRAKWEAAKPITVGDLDKVMAAIEENARTTRETYGD